MVQLCLNKASGKDGKRIFSIYKDNYDRIFGKKDIKKNTRGQQFRCCKDTIDLIFNNIAKDVPIIDEVKTEANRIRGCVESLVDRWCKRR